MDDRRSHRQRSRGEWKRIPDDPKREGVVDVRLRRRQRRRGGHGQVATQKNFFYSSLRNARKHWGILLAKPLPIWLPTNIDQVRYRLSLDKLANTFSQTSATKKERFLTIPIRAYLIVESPGKKSYLGPRTYDEQSNAPSIQALQVHGISSTSIKVKNSMSCGLRPML